MIYGIWYRHRIFVLTDKTKKHHFGGQKFNMRKVNPVSRQLITTCEIWQLEHRYNIQICYLLMGETGDYFRYAT